MGKLQPNLRFSEFEGEYSAQKFQDIFLFSTGKNIKQKEASPDFEIPCVRYGELYHMYNEVIHEVINKTNLDKEELNFSSGDEILLPSAGEDPLDIGSASALCVKDVAIGRTINILKPKNKSVYSSVFVSYYINQKLRRKISSLAKGVSISNVYNSDLKTLKINLPSLHEQEKIATFLTSVDQRLQLLEKKKAKLEAYKKGVMQQIFSQEVMFKDEKGNNFPDWEEKRLGDVVKLKNGYAFKSSSYNDNGDFKIITISNVQNGILDTKNCNKVNSVPSDIQKHQQLAIGDLLVSLTGNVGRIAKVNIENCLLNQRVGKLEVYNAELNFIFHLLRDTRFISKMISLAQGGAQPNLGKSDIELYQIKLPSVKEQQKIATFLSSIDENIAQVTLQIEKSKSFKKGLLQKMFV